MTVLTDIDVLRDVALGRVPQHIARRDKLVALRAQAMALARELDLLRARASWHIVPLEPASDGSGAVEGVLCVDGRHLRAPWLIPASGRLTAVACAVYTIGDALELQVAELFAQRRASLAVALDGLGNELLFALSRRVQDRLLAQARCQGLTVAGELRAGDPGLELQAQQTVLALAGAADIGVALTSTMMMNPTKSSSFVQGVGLELPAQHWSRCDHCRSRERCALVKEEA